MSRLTSATPRLLKPLQGQQATIETKFRVIGVPEETAGASFERVPKLIVILEGVDVFNSGS